VPQPDLRIAGRRLSLLDLDPSLLPACGDAAARRYLTAPAMRIARGAWALPSVPPDRYARWLGMLVVDGLMIRTVRVSGLECCELLGPGDVIRPWDREDDLASLAAGVSWRALEETRVALLDDTFARMACHWPEVLSALMRRSLRRSGSLTVHLAIAQVRRADARLMALFWHLADRWGRVTKEGVVVELELTHGLLSRLTCLRRPTVSLTLKELEATGELTRISRSSWLLRGTEPGTVQRLTSLPAAA
jgi:CRP/FNR family transcriptional regulator, cyclic AMP receptor protein